VVRIESPGVKASFLWISVFPKLASIVLLSTEVMCGKVMGESPAKGREKGGFYKAVAANSRGIITASGL